MATVKKTYRLDESILKDIKSIAEDERQSENQTVETALKFYRDYHYMGRKACFINEQILQVIQASFRMAEHTINQKTNKLVSELAIQSAIQNMIIADSLEVSQKDIHTYRLKALDFLRESQRIFRMDELTDE
jgi:hypothetical protein